LEPDSPDWRKPEPDNDEIDILFLTCNRIEFTRAAFETLIRNTDWDLVTTLHLFDDGSTDGTVEYLRAAAVRVPAKVNMVCGKWRCPLVALLRCVKESTARYIAKIDNDVICPPHWLRIAKRVMDSRSDLDLLGMGYQSQPLANHESAFDVQPAPFIGGVGLFRLGVVRDWYEQKSQAFRWRDKPEREYAGIDQTQMNVGWLVPSLPMFLLDKMPIEPWKSLSDGYVKAGLQRDWGKYSCGQPGDSRVWDWWLNETA